MLRVIAMAWGLVIYWLLGELGAFSATAANDLANYLCRGTAPTTLTGPIKLSVHTADPGATGANEVAGGSYARQAANYNAASGGACTLPSSVTFNGMPAGTFTHIGLWDSSGTPKFLQGAALSISRTLLSGDSLVLTAATNTFTGS